MTLQRLIKSPWFNLKREREGAMQAKPTIQPTISVINLCGSYCIVQLDPNAMSALTKRERETDGTRHYDTERRKGKWGGGGRHARCVTVQSEASSLSQGFEDNVLGSSSG